MAMASCLLRTVAAAAAADGSQSFNPTSYRKRKIAVKTLKSFQIPLPYCSPPHLLNPPLPEVRNQAMAKENGGSEEPKSQEIWDFARVLWTFLRPHTFYGTLVASCSLAVRVWTENPNLMKWSILTRAFCGLVELLCGNSYIVGINQIYDVEIDKVNKPFLPIAAGRITRKQAWVLTTSFLVIGLSTATFNSGPFLSSLYCFALLLGTLYTVPPFRLKRFPIAAFLCIALVRGFLVNFGVYYASRSVLGLPFQWSPPVIFITTFVTFFGLVIALTKDLSDIEGDRRYKIITFATKLGVRRLAFFGSGILLLNYVAAILAAIYMPQAFRQTILIPTHTIMAISLIFQTIALDQAKYTKEAASSFYMFLWKLFYAEYLVFPFV
ncbi:probable homogentisate phytyltransferase 2, chloroplastic isoform X1 [Cucurbita maxima]|uniref:Probable homogentisate phytyltransferase 2, chloroplastic isoform X1 n=1 Tax=Cucurbita maxima TaxID=3661 RepID=A0A6J1KWQ7_CUCMA|nr:probable homogentisate phytyltransferase 2, chloroplastic isoform X1 [Cucurbita maxima]